MKTRKTTNGSFRDFVLKSGTCTCSDYLCDRCERIIDKHEGIVESLKARISDLAWTLNPDRMGH